MSWTTAILHVFSQEADLLMKAIIKCVNIKLWDIPGYFHLRNEFDFWKVHGIMNTSVSRKVSEARRASRSLCKIPEVFMIP